LFVVIIIITTTTTTIVCGAEDRTQGCITVGKLYH
jgi:hypothetical protein